MQSSRNDPRKSCDQYSPQKRPLTLRETGGGGREGYIAKQRFNSVTSSDSSLAKGHGPGEPPVTENLFIHYYKGRLMPCAVPIGEMPDQQLLSVVSAFMAGAGSDGHDAPRALKDACSRPLPETPNGDLPCYLSPPSLPRLVFGPRFYV